MFIVILVVLVSISIFFTLRNSTKTIETSNKNICRGYLTDKEYLDHMIPHHQVAIDISLRLQKETKNPKMQEILRELLWTQNYEIDIMKFFKNNLPNNDMSNHNIPMNRAYRITQGDLTKPNLIGLTNTYCDPNFFEPEKHMQHMEHMKLTDKMYIKHMIPHHLVAVDMSKVLLQNTNNDFMIYLVNRIIRSQQHEIVLLNNLLENKYNISSNMIN